MFGQRALRYTTVAAIITFGTSLAYASVNLPHVKISKNGTIKVSQDGVGVVTASPNPLAGPPRIEGKTPSKDINNLIKNVDGPAHIPQDAAAAAGDAVAKSVENEVNKVIERIKQKLWAMADDWKKQAMPYAYVAAAAFILILMVPGFVGSLFAIWLVRVLDRRTARKRQRELKDAIAVVKSQAEEITTKLAA